METPGIDGVFVGPSDLSMNLTNGAVQNPSLPEVETALDIIADVARQRGKIAGVHSATAERAAELAQKILSESKHAAVRHPRAELHPGRAAR